MTFYLITLQTQRLWTQIRGEEIIKSLCAGPNGFKWHDNMYNNWENISGNNWIKMGLFPSEKNHTHQGKTCDLFLYLI